jgi:anaerobic magnesium-protoporphyrin IX monomethyl ester cyclase
VTDYARYNLINPIMRMDAMSRERLSRLLSDAFAAFYADKMRRLPLMAPHKREYMARVSKLLMEESYLSAEVTASTRALQAPAEAEPAPARQAAEVVA